MSFNFIASGGSVKPSTLCLYDSNIGYEADFSVNGEVGGWTLYDGIHTYGCWNNFLFGTLYGDTSLIGRHYTFKELAAEKFHTVKIIMKLNLKERGDTQKIPKYGKLSWITVGDPSWTADKTVKFDLNTSGDWYTYYINMGEVSGWQGDVFNLRINPILQDGRDGDEFFIRAINILSTDTYKCTNGDCDYYMNYQHPCLGVGKCGTCSSKHLDYLVREGSTFVSAVDQLYTIEKNVNDILIININGYGDESIKLPSTMNATGNQIAYILTKEISKINVGGYSEVEVTYNLIGQFIIHSGTYVDDSIVIVGNSPAAITFNFYDENGKYQATESVGQCPASGYRSLSSFKISTNRILRLFDNNDDSNFLFSPFIYNVEGGRRDWLNSGLGVPKMDVRGQENDDTRVMNRYYDRIDNANKTIIDFNHPFNASGRITKIYAAITLDDYEDSFDSRGDYDENRVDTQLSGAEIMFFRPLKDGTIKVLNTIVPIKNRDHASGNLYSITQEYVEIDCDIFVNKGDLIGIYNANIYRGQSISGEDTDALFYQISGKAKDILKVRTPKGEGSAGLLLYARSDQLQTKLLIDIDLSRRINVESVEVIGTTINEDLEYNIARCLDVNWNIDLFGGDHTTAWVYQRRPYVAHFYNHPNVFYGKECLTDGIKVVSDGLAGTSYSIDLQSYHSTEYENINTVDAKDGGVGVIVNNPQYFHVNGDSEWLTSYLLAGKNSPFAVNNFKHDPISFTLICPAGKKKMLGKLRIYFKERFNFRSFALSFFKGDFHLNGTADISTFDLIPNRLDGVDTPWSRIILDGMECVPENEELWNKLDLYLGKNPIIGHEIIKITSVIAGEYDPYIDYVSPYGGVAYNKTGIIINNDQQHQALTVDWTTFTIEWPASEELGFRLYCDYHESTKICEMELFCSISNTGSLIAGSIAATYSEYGDSIWLPEIIQKADNCAYIFIGDTPQYITVEISPIIDMTLKEICVNISSDDVFLGEKGCQQQVFPIEAKTGDSGDSFPIQFKNVYGKPYDLYVNIETPICIDNGLIYYSKMNNEDSILNPKIGADSYYKKGLHYGIRNNNYNVAINCPVYGMKNLIDNAVAWYSYDNGNSWSVLDSLSSAVSVDINNLPDMCMTMLNIPVLKRSKWWKIGFLDSDVFMNVREIKVYYKGKEITNINFYHEKEQSYVDGASIDTASHLNNTIIDGSYYILTGNQYISIELPNVQEIDRIVIYHDFLEEYENTLDIAGIDSSTAFCLQGYGKLYQTDTIHDYSYYEHRLEIVGSDIYCDNGNNPDVVYNFTEDFSDCSALVDWAVDDTYDSIFTCSSGVSGEDWVYMFDIGIANWSNAAGYKIPVIYAKQYKPIDQDWVFEFKFKFNLEYVHDNVGNNYTHAGVSVGVFNTHRYYRCDGIWSHSYDPYFEGAQMLFADNKFGLAIQGHWCEGTQPYPGDGYTTTTGVVYGTIYYCIVGSDGNNNYIAKAWTDDWNGANQVCDLAKNSEIKWTADKIGVGSGWTDYYMGWEARAKGWTADFDFTSSFAHDNKIFNSNSIRFSGTIDEHIQIDYDNSTKCNLYTHGFDFKDKRFTFDTFIKFKSLPVDGEQIVLASCWETNIKVEEGFYAGSSWAFTIENVSEIIKLRFYIVQNEISSLVYDYTWNPDQYRWYHIRLSRGEVEEGHPRHYSELFINGHVRFFEGFLYGYDPNCLWADVDNSINNIVIGKNFNGWLQEFRISSDYSAGGERIYYYFDYDYLSDIYFKDNGIPTKSFEKYYTFSLYISDDNLVYGLYANVDCVFENFWSYYDHLNFFSQKYYTYFAIDLGHSYALDIIRSFPVDEAHQFDLHNNILYSNIDTSDPSIAFKILNIEDINTDFNGGDKTLPDNWNASGGSENYILSNKLYQSIKSGHVNLTGDFYLVGDFDLEIEYELINSLNIGSWFCGLQIQDVTNINNSIKMDRAFYDGHNRYRFNVKDNSSSWTTSSNSITNHQRASIRFVRSNQIFFSYIKDLDGDVSEDYIMFGYCEMTGNFGNEIVVSIITQSDIPDYPTVKVEWDNLIFNIAEPIYSSYNDAKWLRIKMLNGDGITKTIKRIGIYPNISIQISKDDHYNTEWVSLGESITSYVGEENVALTANVEASSYVGTMRPENAVNGLLTSDLNLAWVAEKGSPQWITVILSTEMQIYRIVVHLNYDGKDSNHLIQDYKIQVSTDNVIFNTIFDISGNTSYLRTHDLVEPITARYVRIYITGYKSQTEYVIFSGGSEYWSGITMRQIEIYEYYGFTVIDSETYPIIAVDLKQNYFITGHSMVGVDFDTTYTDWDNDNSNYTYSNSNLANPYKVSFGYWGDVPGYEKWVVVKRNTATHYPTVPTLPPPIENEYTDTNDFLKHLIIKGSVNENITRPNPIECHWMWNSSISTLGYSYNYIRTTYTQRSLKIEYPESNQSDHVYFREGDDFGIDEDFSWRDGFGFHWYIDDINNLDLNYGYIYFGGYDSTDAHNSVIYKWYLPTLSGSLQSGWNDLALTMKAADEIEWTKLADISDEDPRILHLLTLQKIGMVFKGKDKILTMYIDGFIVERNHFKDMSYFDRGLYMHGNDLLKINVGELDFAAGTLEFFIRPDWKLTSGDIYNEFKFRSLFHFGNVANDVFGAALSVKGLEIYCGNVIDDFTLFIITDLDFDIIDTSFHMAFVFSNDGTGISNDGSTLRVYFNNGLVAKSTIPWRVSDRKHFNFMFGGQSLLTQKMQGGNTRSSSVDAVVSNLKIYNYCKIDFSDSMRMVEIVDKSVLVKPSELIEISKDNLTFYKIGDNGLPFYYKNILQNDSVIIYVKTNIPKGLNGKEIRTAHLLGQWDIGV